MNEKKDCIKLLKIVAGCFVGGLLLIGIFVWAIDPLYHYHAPLFRLPIVLEDAVYQTAGAARNLEYDSAIVGTSMTENMHTSWFDGEMGWNTMKLSYSGARSSDLKAIFGQMSRKEGKLENMVMDLNDYQLTVPGWTKYVEHPAYLYDRSLLNDYEYLYNHDIVVRCVARCLDGMLGVKDNIDTAYTWEEDSLFGKEIALETSRDIREQHLQDKDNNIEEAYLVSGVLSDNIEEKLQVCQENLDNILPFLEENPDTNVYVMIPPYSMLYWEEKVLSGELENILAIYAYAVEKLLQYDNVRVYYFQNEWDIITNLDNYRDSCHHRPEYNRYMFECIRDGKNEMTLQNYQALFREMYDFAKDYPYMDFWAE